MGVQALGRVVDGQAFADMLALPPPLLDLLPVAVYACDAEGRLCWFNKRATELWMRVPRLDSEAKGDRFCGAYHFLDEQGALVARDECLMAQVLRTGRKIGPTAATILRPDGSSIVVMVHIDPIVAENGQILGAINCFQEAADQQEALRRSGSAERRSRDVLSALPAAVYTTDADGIVTTYNQASVKLWGRAPEIGVDQWCGSHRLFWPDGREMALHECPMAVSIKTRRPLFGEEAVLERPDGQRVPFLAYPMPLFGEEGEFAGAVNMLVDITERKEGEAALAASEARQRAILEATPECVKIVAPDGALLYMNMAGLGLIGATGFEQVTGMDTSSLVAPEQRAVWQANHGRICAGERVNWEFDLVGLHGTRRTMEAHGVPLPLPDGRVAQLALTRDVTSRKRAEKHQKILIDELNHRVKNTLAIVQGLAHQSFRDLPGEQRDKFTDRLAALAAAHDLLTRENWGTAGLHSVADVALAEHRCTHPERISIGGADLRLSPKQAVSLAMALHELGANAVRHGALSGSEGIIELCWTVDDTGWMKLRWEERHGPPVTLPARRGFGTRMIERGLAQEIGGVTSLEFRPTGVVCVIEGRLGETVPGT